MFDSQNRTNNDAVSRDRERERARAPGLGGEVMSSILEKHLDWNYKFVSHLSIEKKAHLGKVY